MRRIVFFGDSNTYGYEPGEIYGGRYPFSVRWADRLAENFRNEWEILSRGLNGRCIPGIPADRNYMDPYLDNLGFVDVFAVMLGTNDVFLSYHPDAAAVVRKMETFLSYLQTKENLREILLIAPPATGPEEMADIRLKIYAEEAKKLSAGYREIAEKRNIRFVDADAWHIPMTYDDVHFSEEGHRIFAAEMKQYMETF